MTDSPGLTPKDKTVWLSPDDTPDRLALDNTPDLLATTFSIHACLLRGIKQNPTIFPRFLALHVEISHGKGICNGPIMLLF